MSIEFDRLLAQERRVEQVRRNAHRREADRQRGVAWSGLAPDPFRPCHDDALAAEAARRLRNLETWRAGRTGRLLWTLAEVQRAAQAAYAAAESVRSALARSSDGPPPLDELATRIARLTAAAWRTDRLMDEHAAAALSGEACATNTASNSPSTVSPTSSAS